jgi:phosphate transport system ATP-binding protein
MNMVESGVSRLDASTGDRTVEDKASTGTTERGPLPGSIKPAHSAKPADSMKPKIEVNDLNFFYGKYHALKNINLRIPEKKVTVRRAAASPRSCAPSTRCTRSIRSSAPRVKS